MRRVLEQRYRLDDAEWQQLLERFAGLGYRAALVGPEGSGKTTLLEDFEVRLRAQDWKIFPIRLNLERRRPSAGEWQRLAMSDDRELVTLDGFEQLSWWGKRRLERLSREAGGLLITSHREGRLPVLRRHSTSLELLEELVGELAGSDEAERLRPRLAQLFEQHRGNIRDCLRDLYDVWSAGA